MNKPIVFFVSGDPKGQPRPRAFARRVGNKFVARVFDAGTAEGWKSRIAVAAKSLTPAQPYTDPVRVRLHFFFPRPKAHFRTGKNAHLMRDDAPSYHIAKPDCDNLAKAVLDAMTQLGGWWGDDQQVASLAVCKSYVSTIQLHPGVNISVSQCNQ
ncbi:RusA family crossover junction endodeoxyribonuclease [Geminisphaera colitermitum]|uniref:RusA family crossover junction endodeoxyribonuclease n=1 Tax=Geminisphaera colitermitum TaxID=1148786 RepID=UPI0001964E60|nr:RusA family crossover junction endodeoxyribonuclease [Geminisphaera colitermitum]